MAVKLNDLNSSATRWNLTKGSGKGGGSLSISVVTSLRP